MRFEISLCKFTSSNFFKTIADFEVSGNPPLLLIMTADPLLAASRLVLPKGSFHLEHTTDILTDFKKLRIKSLFLKPKLIKKLFLIINNE